MGAEPVSIIFFLLLLKFATTLVDLLFIELMYIFYMWSKCTVRHTSHTWIEIVLTNHKIKGWFNRDSAMKAPCWCRDSNLDHTTQVHSFAATPSLQDLAIFMAPHGWPHSSGQYSSGPLLSKQSARQFRLSLSLYALKEICCPSAWLISSHNRARLWFLSAAPGVPKRYPIQVLSWPNAA